MPMLQGPWEESLFRATGILLYVENYVNKMNGGLMTANSELSWIVKVRNQSGY